MHAQKKILFGLNLMTMNKNFKINDEIDSYEKVRIIGENIESKIVTLNEAKKIAASLNLDLIEINTKTNPPILKIANFEKLLYEWKRNEKKNKNATTLKEIYISANISEHDLNIKVNKAIEFLKKNYKVKVILVLKGRELARKEESQKSIYEFIVKVEDYGVVENSIKNENNKTIVILKKK